jgi:hypothetical protein
MLLITAQKLGEIVPLPSLIEIIGFDLISNGQQAGIGD